jgi:taurine dioxygenase
MKITRVAGALGAVVEGVTLTDSSTDFAEIKRLLVEHEVLFFPEQHLTPEQQVDFARRFGEPSVSPVARLLGATEPTPTVIVDTPDNPNLADVWHTDVTWTATPPMAAILCMELIPEFGGDTVWVSATKAYDALSEPMKQFLCGLTATHDNSEFVASFLKKADETRRKIADALREHYPPVVHPIVRTHPETGRRVLFYSDGSIRRINELTKSEGRVILDFLDRHVADPSLHCRWSWSEGDVAIWDERSTLHRAAADHVGQHRRIRRVEIDGDRPYFDPAGRTLAQLGR